MPFMTSTPVELIEQFNTFSRRKYINPAIVIIDPVVGAIVRHGKWTYRACEDKGLVDLLKVAMAWNSHTPRKPKINLLNECVEFIHRLEGAWLQGSTPSELASASRFVFKAIGVK